MGVYHNYDDAKDVCRICLAGAVIAERLGVPYNRTVRWSLVPDDSPVVSKLEALDQLMEGNVAEAYAVLYQECMSDQKSRHFDEFRNIYSYKDNKVWWLWGMVDMLNMLKKIGV